MPFRASGWGPGLGRDGGGCWGVLPACGVGGDPGPRGWWQGGPLSSSPPPGPGSAVQTAPPAPWLTPAEPPRSHTAPYTLHGPRRKKVVEGSGVGEGGEVRVLHTHIHVAARTQEVGVQQKHWLSSRILCARLSQRLPCEYRSWHCSDI